MADKLRVIDRFRGAPLIWPIAYETFVYGVAVMIVRGAELIRTSELSAALGPGALKRLLFGPR